MIKSWQHKGLKAFFVSGNKKRIVPAHEKRLKIILQRLNAAIAAKEPLNTVNDRRLRPAFAHFGLVLGKPQNRQRSSPKVPIFLKVGTFAAVSAFFTRCFDKEMFQKLLNFSSIFKSELNNFAILKIACVEFCV